MAAPQKQNIESLSHFETSQKWQKGIAGARSFGLVLTHIDHQVGNTKEAIPNFENFAKVQDDFYRECEGCYIFG